MMMLHAVIATLLILSTTTNADPVPFEGYPRRLPAGFPSVQCPDDGRIVQLETDLREAQRRILEISNRAERLEGELEQTQHLSDAIEDLKRDKQQLTDNIQQAARKEENLEEELQTLSIRLRDTEIQKDALEQRTRRVLREKEDCNDDLNRCQFKLRGCQGSGIAIPSGLK